VASLVWRPTLGPLDRLCAFFGIGGVDATVANAVLLATSGLVGLIYNQAAPHILGATDPLHAAVGLATGLGAGLAMTWIAARAAPADDDPPGIEM
jgi:hypothetical protein